MGLVRIKKTLRPITAGMNVKRNVPSRSSKGMNHKSLDGGIIAREERELDSRRMEKIKSLIDLNSLDLDNLNKAQLSFLRRLIQDVS